MKNISIKNYNTKVKFFWFNYMLLYFMFFFIGTETCLVLPLLPTIAKNFNTNPSIVAYTVTAYAVVYAFVAPFLGNISDKHGRIKFIIIGSAIFFLGNILCSLSLNVSFLICSRSITGLGGAMSGPAMWSYIADTSNENIRGRLMSIGMSFFSLGQVLGVPIASFLAVWKGWQWAFRSIGIGVILTVTTMIIYFKVSHIVENTCKLNVKNNFFTILKNKELVLVLTITFFCQSANIGTYTYLGEILNKNYNFHLNQLGFMVTITGISSIIGSLIGGRLSDKWRNNNKEESSLILVWTSILGISILLLTLIHILWISIIFIVFWFLASGAFSSAQQTLLTLINPNLRGTFVSWNNSFMYAGSAVGIFILGYSWENGMYIGWIAFMLVIISIVFTLILTTLRSYP